MPINGINSINYNAGAAVALADFNSTNNDLQKTYNAVSTGKLINGPTTNPAVWAVSQRAGSDTQALDAVVQSLQRNQSVANLAVAAGQQIVDLLNQLKQVVVAAADQSTDANSRAAYQAQFTNLVQEINNTANTAAFNGSNLVSSSATAIYGLASADGSVKITLLPQNLTVATGKVNAKGITFSSATTFATAAEAQTLLAQVNSSITNVTADVAQLGSNGTNIDNQLNSVQVLQQQLTAGVSNLVDADLAKESAQLQALQAKQQLGVQALSIANSSKAQLLNLFR